MLNNKYFKTKPKTNSKVRLQILTPKIQLQIQLKGQTPDSTPRLHSILSLYTMPNLFHLVLANSFNVQDILVYKDLVHKTLALYVMYSDCKNNIVKAHVLYNHYF